MIDNVVLIVSGCLHNQHTPELLEKCHPLGMFEQLAALAVASNMQELYQLVLIDTPLAKYFEGSLSREDLTEMHLEIMRNMLYKSWIEDFHGFCGRVGGTTREVMSEFLSFEADRRAIAIPLNREGGGCHLCHAVASIVYYDGRIQMRDKITNFQFKAAEGDVRRKK